MKLLKFIGDMFGKNKSTEDEVYDILKVRYSNGHTEEIKVKILSYNGTLCYTNEGTFISFNPRHLDSIELFSPNGEPLVRMNF